MTDLKHTPGPWIVHPLMAWVSPAADPDGSPICEMHMSTDGKSCEPQAKADARLIAAAPEMFETLKVSVMVMEGSLVRLQGRGLTVDALKKAIATAREILAEIEGTT